VDLRSGSLLLYRWWKTLDRQRKDIETCRSDLFDSATLFKKKGIDLCGYIKKSRIQQLTEFQNNQQHLVDSALRDQVLAASQSLALDDSLIEFIEKEWIAPATVSSYDAGLDSRMRIDKDYN